MILLYGGAITLGVGLKDTGAAEWIAGHLLSLVGTNPYIVLLLFIVMTITATEFMSNTAAVAMFLPIGMGFAGAVPGLSVLATSFAIALSGGLAFLLVIATPGNAIAYSSGYFSSKDFFKGGFVANLICIFIIFFVAVTWWRFLGAW